MPNADFLRITTMSLHFANYFILKQSKICFIIVEKITKQKQVRERSYSKHDHGI